MIDQTSRTAGRVVVVGGGVTGLVAALRLGQAGMDVTVLEADERLGGQVHTVDFAGARVDVGAEAVHLGTPQVAALVDELGLRSSVVGAAPGASLLLTRRGLVPLPAGVGPTGPTRVRPVLASRILPVAALVRAGLEPLIARLSPADADVSVGAFVRRRFGHAVTDAFVDPLLGNLHGGSVDALSLRATAPQLVPAATGRRSLLLRKSPKRSPEGAMAFATWRGGLAVLIEALAAASGADVRLDSPVTALDVSDSGWTAATPTATYAADAVVLAVPAPAAARLLSATAAPGVGEALGAFEAATVATVALAFDRGAAERCPALTSANGLLLTSSQARTVKAATFLTHKWPHLADAAGYVIRASVGRAGSDVLDRQDDAIIGAVVRELRELTGLRAELTDARVIRWPDAMPQLTVGHLDRVAGVRKQLAALPPLALAGAPLDGLGVGSTVRSGSSAAASVLEGLSHLQRKAV